MSINSLVDYKPSAKMYSMYREVMFDVPMFVQQCSNSQTRHIVERTVSPISDAMKEELLNGHRRASGK